MKLFSLPSIRSALTLAALGVMLLATPAGAQSYECSECVPRIALKTNLLHDAILTPDLGIEISLARKFSLSAEGVWAWWSNNSRHRFWRIYGGWIEGRYWFAPDARQRSLTGHHLGIYGSCHSFDFEFGHKGWQSDGLMYGIGLSYGYSLRISQRLNLDFSARVGFSSGNITEYEPQRGIYSCTSRYHKRYFGLTGLEITLVWFPGRGSKNNPDYNL